MDLLEHIQSGESGTSHRASTFLLRPFPKLETACHSSRIAALVVWLSSWSLQRLRSDCFNERARWASSASPPASVVAKASLLPMSKLSSLLALVFFSALLFFWSTLHDRAPTHPPLAW